MEDSMLPEHPQICPKCKGQMDRGFIVDNSHLGLGVSQWTQGQPKWSFWTGIKKPKEQIPTGTFRCSVCGYLESYARPEFGTG
jgi:hypothetical protein